MNHNILRLKQNEILRNMCVDTNFLQDQLIQPIFISEKVSEPQPITGLDNNYVMNLDMTKKRRWAYSQSIIKFDISVRFHSAILSNYGRLFKILSNSHGIKAHQWALR